MVCVPVRFSFQVFTFVVASIAGVHCCKVVRGACQRGRGRVLTVSPSSGQTVQTFFAGFLTGAVFASPAGVTPTAYDGHATAHYTVGKSD